MGPRDKSQFEDLEAKYEIVKRLGEGCYGVTLSAREKSSGVKVAVRVIKDAVKHQEVGKRLLREVALLRHVRGHQNILSILDVIESPPGQAFRDIFLITDLMESDLHRIIQSPQALSEDHVCYFAYQILCGLKYIHSAGIIHRDLQPRNLLVNANCDLKIADVGSASIDEDDESDVTRQSVRNRWYFAPERLLGVQEYDAAVDVWSAGCIVAELLRRKPLFPGSDAVEMIALQIRQCGAPPHSEQTHLSAHARQLIAGLREAAPVPWCELLRPAGGGAGGPGGGGSVRSAGLGGLVGGMLEVCAARRLSAPAALRHPALAPLRHTGGEAEAVCAAPPLPLRARAAVDNGAEAEAEAEAESLRDSMFAEIRACQDARPT